MASGRDEATSRLRTVQILIPTAGDAAHNLSTKQIQDGENTHAFIGRKRPVLAKTDP